MLQHDPLHRLFSEARAAMTAGAEAFSKQDGPNRVEGSTADGWHTISLYEACDARRSKWAEVMTCKERVGQTKDKR